MARVPVWGTGPLRFAHPARAVADLEGASEADLIDAVDAVRHKLRLTLMDLIDVWESLSGHAGARRLLALAATGVLDVESGGERRMLRELFDDNPPPPDAQVWVTDHYRVDFAFVFAALILDYYGIRYHRDRVDEDAYRAGEVRFLGWDHFVVTKSMVSDMPGLGEEVQAHRRYREVAFLEGRLKRPPLPVQRRRRVPLRTNVPLG